MNDGWEIKKLSEVCVIKPPKAEARQRLGDNDLVSFLPMEDLGIDEMSVTASKERKLKDVAGSYTYFADNDVLLAKITPCFENGKLGIARNLKNGIGFGSSEYVVFRLNGHLIPEYLYYFLSQETFREEGRKRMSGAVGHKRVSKDFIENSEIGVPPIAEQKRIVAILDEAFEAIDKAKQNAEKNLQNARELFESYLQSVFTQRGGGNAAKLSETGVRTKKSNEREESSSRSRTGGRDATTRHIPPKLALAVGMPQSLPSINWTWTSLRNLAQLESGHTPSRRHPEYWGGSVPWIGIRDARANHGRVIGDTEQKINELGLANSSSRLLPKGTVCLSRTASVGYVTIMGKPMATSQDFVNWICSDRLSPQFLKFLFLAEGREGLLRYSSGSVHQTIYYPEAKAFHIAHPSFAEQERIVEVCNSLTLEVERLESIYRRKLAALDELKKSLLHQAFSGELTKPNVIEFPLRIPNITPTDLHAGIIAIAYRKHQEQGKLLTFHHVKAEKIVHLAESFVGLELDRNPKKNAAGPNDFPRMHKVEHRAKMANYFHVEKNAGIYSYRPGNNLDSIVSKTKAALGERFAGLQTLIEKMVPMDTKQAEILTTTFAAWNNLLIDGLNPTDEAIVYEARENWHEEKLKIPRERFFAAVEWMKTENILPKGLGKKVEAKEN